MDVGKRITNLRATKGLSTTALAHKAGLDALEISLAEFFAEETENSLMEDETLRTFYRLSAYQRKALLLFLKTMQDE